MPDTDNTDRREAMRRVAGSAAIGGGLLLLFGFYYHSSGLIGVTDSALYNASVTGKVWLLLIGGTLSLASAGVLTAGWTFSLAVDACVAILIGSCMATLGVYQAAYSLGHGGLDFEAILMLIFGGMFIHSGWRSWVLHTQTAGATHAAPGPMAAAVPANVEGLKESARDRLLQAKTTAKANPTSAAPTAAPVATPASSTASASAVAATSADGATVATQSDAAPVASAPPASKDAEPDGGFLAELGRGG